LDPGAQSVSQRATIATDLVGAAVVFDSQNATFTIATGGQPLQNFHILLDTDANDLTGYGQTSTGAEYMIENNGLYQFTGADQGAWSWTRIGNVPTTALGGNVLQVTVPVGNLNLLPGGKLNVRIQNWKTDWSALLDELPSGANIWQVGTPQIVTQTGVKSTDLVQGQACLQSDNLVLTLQTVSGAIPHFQVYLDADGNSSTGFKVGPLGADYLIQDGVLSQFNGKNQAQNTWTSVGSVTVASPRGNAVQVTIPSSTFKLTGGGTVNCVFRTYQGANTILDVLPRATGQWPITEPASYVQSGSAGTDLVRGLATIQPGSIAFTLRTLATPLQNTRIYLDTDANSGTGAAQGSLGADYMVANGVLYQFSGANQIQWNWAPIGNVAVFNLTANSLEIVVPTTAINHAGGKTNVSVVSGSNDGSTTYDTLPRNGAGWGLNW
jgi:hypothetical protein